MVFSLNDIHQATNGRGIYALRSLSTGKVLIGQTSQGFRTRFAQHYKRLKNNRHDNSYVQNHYNKYGSEDFVFEIIDEVKEVADLDAREIYWMSHYDSTNRETGFNLREGGKRGLYGPELKQRVKDGIKNSDKAQSVKKNQALKQAKAFSLLNPLGERVDFVNLLQFCKKNNLNRGGLWRVLVGKGKSYKGWRSLT